MDITVSLDAVANVVTFIAPGYFIIQIYSLIYAKKDREFSRLLIESIVYSLPIVTGANIIWEHIFGQLPVSHLNIGYASLVLIAAVASGATAAYLRTRWPVKNIANALGISAPQEDFVKTQLLRVQKNDSSKSAVTVQLKSGAIFSGTAERFSHYHHGSPSYYFFSNLAWFNEKTRKWDVRSGGVMVRGDEIEYIETSELSD